MKRKILKKKVDLNVSLAEVIVSARERAEGMAILSKRSFEYACAAKRDGKEEFAADMLRLSADLESFSVDLFQLAREMESGVVIANGFRRTQKLPRVFARCERVLSALPAPKVGLINPGAVTKCLDKARRKLERLRAKGAAGTEIHSVLEEGFARFEEEANPAYKDILERKRKELAEVCALEATAVSEEPVAEPVAEAESVSEETITLTPVAVEGLAEDGEQ